MRNLQRSAHHGADFVGAIRGFFRRSTQRIRRSVQHCIAGVVVDLPVRPSQRSHSHATTAAWATRAEACTARATRATSAGIKETAAAQLSARAKLLDAVVQFIHVLQAEVLRIPHAPAHRNGLIRCIRAGRQSTHIA